MDALKKIGRLAWRLAQIVVRNPRRLRHVLGYALNACEEVADPAVDLMRIPSVSLDDLLPEPGAEDRVTLALIPKAGSSISVVESAALALLLKKARARSVFEFGTYKGFSIAQLTLNLPDDALICTLDLPEDDPRSALPITDSEDIAIAREKDKGSLVPPDLRPRIRFLRQDSALFDETPYAGRMDFVFVDGAHNDAYVRNDSEKGWRMLRPGGMIVWHDCRKEDPAVVRYLLAAPCVVRRILQTTLAYAVKPASH